VYSSSTELVICVGDGVVGFTLDENDSYRCSRSKRCSLTADFHRALSKGGWAGNPRPHLQLLYEAAPLAFIVEKSGGLGTDGVTDLLDIRPTSLHERVCCFLGSALDIKDLKQYGDLQQQSKMYLA